ncbi:MAG TPA: choice-of-anchor tandem repeat NxxGxxAF-containing protein [Candidatus Binatia bacterium]|jgi:hypothetical protein
MCRTLSLLLLASLVLGLSPVPATAEFTVVAVGGDVPPRGTGAFAEELGTPVLDDHDEAAFPSNLRDNGFISGGGIFRSNGTAGDLTTIMLNGDPLPDLNGNLNQAVQADIHLVDTKDQVAAKVGLAGTLGGQLDNTAIYLDDGSGLVQLVRTNDLVPGGVGRFAVFSDISTNDAGQVAFLGSLRDTTDAQGLYRADKSGVTQIVRVHSPAPGSAFTLDLLGTGPLNSSGQMLFSGLDNSDQTNNGLFRGDGVSTVAIALFGGATPDGNGTYFVPATSGAINDAGQVAFVDTDLQNTQQGALDNAGVFRSDGTTAVTIARKGDLAPDQNGRYLQFVPVPLINASGQVLFQTSISGGSNGSNDGLFLADGSSASVVARINEDAPGGGRFSFLGPHALNDNGQVAFFAQIDLQDGGGIDDTSGLFLYDPLKGLVAVARNGQQLANLGPISAINFAGTLTAATTTEDGFNQAGHVAFRCFAGESVAVAIWSPSPPPVCGEPVTTGGSPKASDCLFILKVAVGSETCTPEDCVCNVNGDNHTTATDALLCLKKAVGQDVTLNCPC